MDMKVFFVKKIWSIEKFIYFYIKSAKMKKYCLTLFVCISSFLSFSQVPETARGYYGELGFGVSSDFHKRNVSLLFSESNIDTSGYRLIKFITNKDTIQYLTANSNVSIVEMLVENDKVSYVTKKNIKVLNPQSKYKMFVLFFMRFPMENKAVYYLYRYG